MGDRGAAAPFVDAPVRLFNSRGRRKEQFVTLRPGAALVYTCGPTVYGYPHIGNMRPYLFADTLRRTLELNGYRVRHVVNITDVGHLTSDADAGEDKMELAAARRGMSAWEIAAHYTAAFERDTAALNVLPPTVRCRATEHIPEMIEMVRALEARGFTYLIDDGVYFDTSRDPHYGELAGGPLVAEEVRSRIGDVAGKRHPSDFALWKLSPAGVRRQMEWDSPWGRGFPGWHIECSAMSSKYLGARFDVHTGGVDHVGVHHTNEIAQSENALGVRPWVTYWLHCAFLTFEGAKMAKSAGGVLRLADLEGAGVPPLAFRYLCLSAHYRSQLAFTEDALAAAATSWRRLVGHVRTLPPDPATGWTDAARGTARRFGAAVNDDLNTPGALAVLWEVVRSETLAPGEKRALVAAFDRVLGLDLARATPERPAAERWVDDLLRARTEARRAGDFAAADEVRRRLREAGILVEDTREGTTWRYAAPPRETP